MKKSAKCKQVRTTEKQGELAQTVERSLCMREVRGSTPRISKPFVSKELLSLAVTMPDGTGRMQSPKKKRARSKDTFGLLDNKGM